jgi:L-iditol 2-dehydrogenase
MAMVARAAGAREVVILGTPGDEALRLRTARELGFRQVINIGQSKPVQAVLDLTNGTGADLVVECSGAPAAIPGTVELVRKRGRICVVGLTGNRPVEMPWDKFAARSVDMQFCMSTSYTSWDRAISLIHGGAVPAERIITHRVPIDQWETAFDAVDRLEALKTLIVPR